MNLWSEKYVAFTNINAYYDLLPTDIIFCKNTYIITLIIVIFNNNTNKITARNFFKSVFIKILFIKSQMKWY